VRDGAVRVKPGDHPRNNKYPWKLYRASDIRRTIVARLAKRPWLPQEDALLGTDVDRVIARQLKRDVWAVYRRRIALGIPPHGRGGGPRCNPRSWHRRPDDPRLAPGEPPPDPVSRCEGACASGARSCRMVPMLKSNVQRPRLRLVVALFLWISTPVVAGLTVVPPVLDALFPTIAGRLESAPPPAPVPAPCSRTLYYYDMAPYVRESVWCCGGAIHERWPYPP
jgi:hypothetical protein